jgi:hypothetical protein
VTVVKAGSQYGTKVGARIESGKVGGSKAPFGGMPYQPDHCVSLNKAGHACSARPVKGTTKCFGHSRGDS